MQQLSLQLDWERIGLLKILARAIGRLFLNGTKILKQNGTARNESSQPNKVDLSDYRTRIVRGLPVPFDGSLILTRFMMVEARKDIQVGTPKKSFDIENYSLASKFFPDYKNGSKIQLYAENKPKINFNLITDSSRTSGELWIALVNSKTEFGMEWEDRTSIYNFHATSNKKGFQNDTD